MKRVGGHLVEYISDFFDQVKNTALVLKEGLELRSDKLRNSSKLAQKHKSQNALKLQTFSRLNTAYEVWTKCESGEYFMKPLGPS